MMDLPDEMEYSLDGNKQSSKYQQHSNDLDQNEFYHPPNL
jgi:hypothetical protein